MMKNYCSSNSKKKYSYVTLLTLPEGLSFLPKPKGIFMKSSLALFFHFLRDIFLLFLAGVFRAWKNLRCRIDFRRRFLTDFARLVHFILTKWIEWINDGAVSWAQVQIDLVSHSLAPENTTQSVPKPEMFFFSIQYWTAISDLILT